MHEPAILQTFDPPRQKQGVLAQRALVTHGVAAASTFAACCHGRAPERRELGFRHGQQGIGRNEFTSLAVNRQLDRPLGLRIRSGVVHSQTAPFAN